MSIPESITVFQTDPNGYFVGAITAHLMIPPIPVPGEPPSYSIPMYAVLVPPPDEIPGHLRKYESEYGPFQIERRTKGTWVQVAKEVPQPEEDHDESLPEVEN